MSAAEPERSAGPYAAELLSDLPIERRPKHVAIVMDGNGRWARSRGWPRVEGHRHGVRSVRRTTEASSALGIRALTLYCLSSENWKRPEAELTFLMGLLQQFIVQERPTLVANNIRLRAIGRRDRLTEIVRQELNDSIDLCAAHTGLELVLAIDYGGRGELVEAARRLAEECQRGQRDPSTIDEGVIDHYLQTSGLPDPDLLIRTGGDLRVSNFLLWQISYAEIWVTDVCWPDFSVELYCEAIRQFARRDRRFGGLNDDSP